MNSTRPISSLTRRRVRCQFLFDDVKSSEADTEGDRSFHPVHTHSLEQATDSLLAQNMGQCCQHSWILFQYLCHTMGVGSSNGATQDIYRRISTSRPNNTNGLHPSSCHFERICHTLSNKASKSTALHSFDCRWFSPGHDRNLFLGLFIYRKCHA